MAETKKKTASKKTASKKAGSSKKVRVNIFDSYDRATELDFQMNAPYLVITPNSDEPTEVWPGENDSLSKQAIKYAGLVARGLVVLKKK